MIVIPRVTHTVSNKNVKNAILQKDLIYDFAIKI